MKTIIEAQVIFLSPTYAAPYVHNSLKIEPPEISIDNTLGDSSTYSIAEINIDESQAFLFSREI